VCQVSSKIVKSGGGPAGRKTSLEKTREKKPSTRKELGEKGGKTKEAAGWQPQVKTKQNIRDEPELVGQKFPKLSSGEEYKKGNNTLSKQKSWRKRAAGRKQGRQGTWAAVNISKAQWDLPSGGATFWQTEKRLLRTA